MCRITNCQLQCYLTLMLGNTTSVEDVNVFKHFASGQCKVHIPLSLTASKVYECCYDTCMKIRILGIWELWVYVLWGECLRVAELPLCSQARMLASLTNTFIWHWFNDRHLSNGTKDFSASFIFFFFPCCWYGWIFVWCIPEPTQQFWVEYRNKTFNTHYRV